MLVCDSCGDAVRKGEHCSNCGTLSLHFSSVGEYLDYIDLPQYEKLMNDNHITFEMLSDLEDADLQQIGISSLGHRKKILNSSKKSSPIADFDDFDDIVEPASWSWRGEKTSVFLLGLFINFIGSAIAISVPAIKSPSLMLGGAVVILMGSIVGVLNRSYLLVFWAGIDLVVIVRFFINTSSLR
jgi:hypothetical protein